MYGDGPQGSQDQEEEGQACCLHPLFLGRARGRISGKGAELQGIMHHQLALHSQSSELPLTRLTQEHVCGFATGTMLPLRLPLCISSCSRYKMGSMMQHVPQTPTDSQHELGTSYEAFLYLHFKAWKLEASKQHEITSVASLGQVSRAPSAPAGECGGALCTSRRPTPGGARAPPT